MGFESAKYSIYLGDSVYAYLDEQMLGEVVVVLETRNGLPTDPSNRIVLESDHLIGLYRWLKRNGLDLAISPSSH